MSGALNIVTNDAGDVVRREHARELGAEVIVALYRLARLAQMHDLNNQAFIRQLEDTHRLIAEYGLRAGADLNILFARRAVFLAGQLVKGSRTTYENATELGELLERAGGSELTISRGVTTDDLRAFTEAIAACHRGETRDLVLTSPQIRLRNVTDAARFRGLEFEERGFEQRIIGTYASAVVAMRRFFEDLKRGEYVLPRSIKRIAQTLVDLSSGTTPAFLGVTEARNANHDEAGRAINSAILAVAMTRELTDQRSVLAQIAMAALLYDVGRPQSVRDATAPGLSRIVPRLSDEAEDRLPAVTSAVLTALGRVNEATIVRTVLTFEALWIRRSSRLGAVYGGIRPPTLQARVIEIARRYNDLVTPEPGILPLAADQALARLAEEHTDATGRTVLRILAACLGSYPIGTVVELSTGEAAEITAIGENNELSARIVTDERGNVVEHRLHAMLGRPDEHGKTRRIVRVLSTDGWRGRAQPTANTALTHAPATTPDRIAVPGEGNQREQNREHDREQDRTRAHDHDHDRTVDDDAPLSENTEALTMFSLPPTTTPGILANYTPTAQGSLATTPLVHVLAYMLEYGLSGSVIFRETSGERNLVYFRNGLPAKVRTHRTLALLGEELVRADAIDGTLLQRSLEEAARMGLRLGEHLTSRGVVSADALSNALKKQLRNRVASLATLPPNTHYDFYQDVDVLDSSTDDDAILLHPLDAIFSAARNWYDRARIHATVSRFNRQILRLHQESDADRANLSDDERRLLATFSGDGTQLAALKKQRLVDEETLASVLYVLAITRQFSFTSQKMPPMARRVLPIQLDTKSMATEYPGPPDRSDDAPTDPPSPPTEPPPPPSTARGSHVTLAPPDTDPAPRMSRIPESPTARQLRGRTQFRLAQAAAERNDFAKAEQLTVSALELDPGRTEYEAFATWIQGVLGSTPIEDCIGNLSDMIAQDPRCDRALICRGRLLKQKGEAEKARADFKAALQINPQNRDALREVRELAPKA